MTVVVVAAAVVTAKEMLLMDEEEEQVDVFVATADTWVVDTAFGFVVAEEVLVVRRLIEPTSPNTAPAFAFATRSLALVLLLLCWILAGLLFAAAAVIAAAVVFLFRLLELEGCC